MSYWLRSWSSRCGQRYIGRFELTTHRTHQSGVARLSSRSHLASRAARVVFPMSSAQRRLQQVREQFRQPSARAYAQAGISAEDNKKAGIICSTKEHSPGHNVATITISNAAKLNIVNSPLLDQVIATCQELSKDDNLRAVVLTGAAPVSGKASSFIGGADIREMSQMTSYDTAKTFITRVHEACKALRDVPVPVIARVNGFSLGAGLEIMAACDLRIATKGSVFGMPEVKIGLPSVVEAALLPGLIGMGRTRRLLYLAENINSAMAEEWGLVEKVVENEAALDQAVDEWVGMIVSMGPKCIRSQKQLMQKWENSTVDEGIQAGVEALAQAFSDGGKEPRGRMDDFLNRNMKK